MLEVYRQFKNITFHILNDVKYETDLCFNKFIPRLTK